MADQQQKRPDPNVGVAALVMKGDRFILEKREGHLGSGTWMTPGGYVEFGESPEETVVREVREETGIEVTDVHFRVFTNDVFEAENKHFITIWFDCKYVSGELKVQAPEEESRVGWFTWDSLPEPLFLPLKNLLAGKTLPAQTGSVWRS